MIGGFVLAKVNRVCKTCEKQYAYCGRCGNGATNPPWMSTWDTENCKEVFQICSNYKQGAVSKEKARNQLQSNCDLRLKYTFKKEIRDLIDEILADSVVETEPKSETRNEGKKGRFIKETED